MPQFLMTLAAALAAGLLGAFVGPQIVPTPGIGGLFAGFGFMAAFVVLWRSFGGTRQDIRNLFA